ncbi:hypothetical protein LXL04_037726 [Taraxacum kok-saghyz]
MGTLPKDVPGTDPVINMKEAAKNPIDDADFLISVFLEKDMSKQIPESFQYLEWLTVSRFIKRRKGIQHVAFSYPPEQLRARWNELREGYNQNQEAGDVPLDIWTGVFDDTNFKIPQKYKPDGLAKYPLKPLSGDGGAGSSGGVKPEVQNEQDSGERVTQEEKNEQNEQGGGNDEQGGGNGGGGRGGGGDGGGGRGGGGDGGGGRGGGGDGGGGRGGGGDGGGGRGGGGDGGGGRGGRGDGGGGRGGRGARRNRCCVVWWF